MTFVRLVISGLALVIGVGVFVLWGAAVSVAITSGFREI